jgi:hypothetical protein
VCAEADDGHGGDKDEEHLETMWHRRDKQTILFTGSIVLRGAAGGEAIEVTGCGDGAGHVVDEHCQNRAGSDGGNRYKSA